VQAAATSSEVRFFPAALDECRALLGRYPTRQAVLLPMLWMLQLNHERYDKNLTEDSTARFIDEFARRAD
jgi:hypothetical protein